MPRWAYERPALRRFEANRWSTLRRVRDVTGDPTVGPYRTYLRAETGGNGPAPVALGIGWDPAGWADLDWRLDGAPVGLDLVTPDSIRFVGGSRKGRRLVVLSIADHFQRWLQDNDPSTEGPRRGLRKPVPVHSTTAATRVVGRHGEALMAVYEDPETPVAKTDQLDYGGLLPPVEDLRERARKAGLREMERRTGIAKQTLSDWIRGANSSEHLLVTVVMALDTISADPLPVCALEGCTDRVPNRRAKWCGDDHRHQGSGLRGKRYDANWKMRDFVSEAGCAVGIAGPSGSVT